MSDTSDNNPSSAVTSDDGDGDRFWVAAAVEESR